MKKILHITPSALKTIAKIGIIFKLLIINFQKLQFA